MFWQFAFTSQTEGIALHSSISVNAKRNAFKTLIIHRRYIVKGAWKETLASRLGVGELEIERVLDHCLKLKNSKIILSGLYFAMRIKRNNFYVTFSKLTL